jgi:hypothetical protein
MEMKEWFVVYQYDKYYLQEGVSASVTVEDFIYGEGTAQGAWLKFKDAEDKLISITRV